MSNSFNLAMLVLASIAALAFGILSAYGLLRAAFALMRQREERLAVKPRTQAARVA